MNKKFTVLFGLFMFVSVLYAQKDNSQDIKSAIANWVDGFNSGDFNTAVSIYAEDFIGYYPNQVDQTRDDIKKQYSHILNNKNLSVIISVDTEEIKIFGDNAYVRMTMTAKIKPIYAPQPSIATDKGLQIWRNEKNGGWKITRSSTFPMTVSGGQ